MTSDHSEKQAAYLAKIIADGRCTRCRKKRRSKYARLCNPCALLQREHARKYHGWKPWKKGGRGRPPKIRAPKTTKVA